MNPFCIPFAIHNMGGALLAMDLGFMGPNYPINTACATGNYCILSCVPRPCSRSLSEALRSNCMTGRVSPQYLHYDQSKLSYPSHELCLRSTECLRSASTQSSSAQSLIPRIAFNLREAQHFGHSWAVQCWPPAPRRQVSTS